MKREDVVYWLSLAEEAHAKADVMRDAECRRAMLQIADGYRRLAKLAGERGAE